LDQRKHARYAVEYAGSFLGEAVTTPGVILDLSETGCRSRTEGIIQLGALLQVLIDVPRYQTLLQVTLARVRWSNGNEFGLEFLCSPSDDKQRLHEGAPDNRRGQDSQTEEEGLASAARSPNFSYTRGLTFLVEHFFFRLLPRCF
jgi:hypothetical protein